MHFSSNFVFQICTEICNCLQLVHTEYCVLWSTCYCVPVVGEHRLSCTIIMLLNKRQPNNTKIQQSVIWDVPYAISFPLTHDDVIKWKHFPRNWSFAWGIDQSPVNSPQKGQWRGALIFSLIYAWMNRWANNRKAVDLRSHRAHCDVNLMNINLF